MDIITIICLIIILICTPTAIFLLRFSYRTFFPKKTEYSNDQKPLTNNIEQRIRMESSHEINIIEEPNNILVIPIRIKRRKSSRHKNNIAKS